MKKIIYVLFALITLYSCSKKDKSPTLTDGSWQFSKLISPDTTINSFDYGIYIQFGEDGTFYAAVYEEDDIRDYMDGNYRINNNKILFSEDVYLFGEVGQTGITYSFNNQTLILAADEDKIELIKSNKDLSKVAL